MAWSHINIGDLWDAATGVLFKMNELGKFTDNVFIASDQLPITDWSEAIGTAISPLSPALAQQSLISKKAQCSWLTDGSETITLQPNSFGISNITVNGTSHFQVNLSSPVKTLANAAAFASAYNSSSNNLSAGFIDCDITSSSYVRVVPRHVNGDARFDNYDWISLVVLEF